MGENMTERPQKPETQPAGPPQQAAGGEQAPGATASDAEESTAPLAAALSAQEIAELQRKAAEYDQLMDRFKRAVADYQNSQKRLERQAEERIAYANELFARELLPVADNLGRALSAASEETNLEQVRKGIELVEKLLYDVLARHGVTPIEARDGDPFDPEVHEAVSLVETEEQEPGRVVHMVQKGFRVHRRLLRPCQVAVSARPCKQAPEREAQPPKES